MTFGDGKTFELVIRWRILNTARSIPVFNRPTNSSAPIVQVINTAIDVIHVGQYIAVRLFTGLLNAFHPPPAAPLDVNLIELEALAIVAGMDPDVINHPDDVSYKVVGVPAAVDFVLTSSVFNRGTPEFKVVLQS